MDLDKYLNVLFEGQAGYVYTPVLQRSTNKWLQKFFRWPNERQSLTDWINLASIELDVYISPTLFSQKSARKDSALGAQVVWVEFDGQEKINLLGLPEPSMVVCTSSETHVHVYWQVAFSPPGVIESLNRKLTYHLEADSSGWDINQVLRPPETKNWKHNLAVKLVSIKAAVGECLTPESFDLLKDPPPIIEVTETTVIPDALDVLACYNIPVHVRKLLQADQPPKGLRSTHLMQVGYSLAELGMAHDEILSLLLVADAKVEKFQNRSDQLVRLSEIASIALNKYSADFSTPVYDFEELCEADFNFFSHWGHFLPSMGSLILSGAPGVGKTQISLQAACHLILQRELLGFDTQCDGNIVFFSLEMPPAGIQWILNYQKQCYNEEERAILKQRFKLAAPPETLTFDQIEKVLREYQPIGVFFDSLSSLSVEDLSNPKDAKLLADWNRHLRNQFGCFTWWVHHNRKATADNKVALKLSDLYGSFIYAAKWDTILMVGRTSDGKTKLHAGKTRYGLEQTYTIRRTPELTFENESGHVNSTGFAEQQPNVGVNQPGNELPSKSSGTLNLGFGGHGNEPH